MASTPHKFTVPRISGIIHFNTIKVTEDGVCESHLEGFPDLLHEALLVIVLLLTLEILRGGLELLLNSLLRNAEALLLVNGVKGQHCTLHVLQLAVPEHVSGVAVLDLAFSASVRGMVQTGLVITVNDVVMASGSPLNPDMQ